MKQGGGRLNEVGDLKEGGVNRAVDGGHRAETVEVAVHEPGAQGRPGAFGGRVAKVFSGGQQPDGRFGVGQGPVGAAGQAGQVAGGLAVAVGCRHWLRVTPARAAVVSPCP